MQGTRRDLCRACPELWKSGVLWILSHVEPALSSLPQTMPGLLPPAAAPLAAPVAGRGPASPKNTWSYCVPPSRPTLTQASVSERVCPRQQACQSHASRYAHKIFVSWEQIWWQNEWNWVESVKLSVSLSSGIIFVWGIGCFLTTTDTSILVL